MSVRLRARRGSLRKRRIWDTWEGNSGFAILSLSPCSRSRPLFSFLFCTVKFKKPPKCPNPPCGQDIQEAGLEGAPPRSFGACGCRSKWGWLSTVGRPSRGLPTLPQGGGGPSEPIEVGPGVCGRASQACVGKSCLSVRAAPLMQAMPGGRSAQLLPSPQWKPALRRFNLASDAAPHRRARPRTRCSGPTQPEPAWEALGRFVRAPSQQPCGAQLAMSVRLRSGRGSPRKGWIWDTWEGPSRFVIPSLSRRASTLGTCPHFFLYTEK